MEIGSKAGLTPPYGETWSPRRESVGGFLFAVTVLFGLYLSGHGDFLVSLVDAMSEDKRRDQAVSPAGHSPASARPTSPRRAGAMSTPALSFRAVPDGEGTPRSGALQVGRALACFEQPSGLWRCRAEARPTVRCTQSRPQAAAPSVMLEACLWHDPLPGMAIFRDQRVARS